MAKLTFYYTVYGLQEGRQLICMYGLHVHVVTEYNARELGDPLIIIIAQSELLFTQGHRPRAGTYIRDLIHITCRDLGLGAFPNLPNLGPFIKEVFWFALLRLALALVWLGQNVTATPPAKTLPSGPHKSQDALASACPGLLPGHLLSALGYGLHI